MNTKGQGGFQHQAMLIQISRILSCTGLMILHITPSSAEEEKFLAIEGWDQSIFLAL